MDMYRFVAVCENDSTSKQLTYTPENFEGVKISQEFRFVPPYGFTPKFALDTMRVIKDDAAFFIAKNVAFGYFLKMKLYVSKLNADGFTYSPLTTLVLNPETIVRTFQFVEFSVDVLNSATNYFNTKSTKRNIPLLTPKSISGTYFKINNVSLNSTPYWRGCTLGNPITWEKSESNNIIYDNDLSLYQILSYESDEVIYQCAAGGTIRLIYAVSFYGVATFNPPEIEARGTLSFALEVHDGTTGLLKSTIQQKVESIKKGKFMIFDMVDEIDVILNAGDFIILNTIVDNVHTGTNFNMDGDAGITVKKMTGIDYQKKQLFSISIADLFENLLGETLFTPAVDTFITSDKYLVGNIKEVGIIPQDFIREISTMAGLVFNFGENTTKIYYLTDYFNKLNNSERIEILIYKDLQVSNYEQVYTSFVVGVEKFNTENNVYYFPFQKKLTFEQKKVGGDDLQLICTKLSADTERIINRLNEAAVGNNQTSNDNYYIVPLRSILSNENINISDFTTPREMAESHEEILSLFFGNYQQKTAQMVDNDGVTNDLIFGGVSQHDDFNFNKAKHLRPIVYEFTALISEADFSEHFAEMVDFNGETVDLFVYSSETTDKLGEIKCKALVFK